MQHDRRYSAVTVEVSYPVIGEDKLETRFKEKNLNNKTRLVCGKCRSKWKAEGRPARCPDCGEVSFAIAVAETRGRPPKAKR